jgi:AraC-like DNA-binding protein
MNENYTNSDFSVDDLVHRSHMSNTYFRKLFLSKYGKTPVKYILSMRLSYAEKLLSHGRYSVLEVAEMSGFSDVKYFSRVMKREYGVPPSELYKHIKP